MAIIFKDIIFVHCEHSDRGEAQNKSNVWPGSALCLQWGQCCISASPGRMQWTIYCGAPEPSEGKGSRRFSKFKLPPMPRGVYELLDQDNDALTFLDPLGDTVINFTI